ncbi:MAG: DNA-binding domain-containing protein [Paludibacter sp.]|nr:DNA-binding domain-containing protein [Paludibacter sp.]
MTDILHKVKANLYPNLLTDDPNDYIARVISERTLNVKDICKVAVSRGGAATTAEAMEHNVNLFMKEMGYQLSDGYSINTGYFTANTLIRGVFNSPAETFNTDKHAILYQFNQGDLLRKELVNISVEITGIGDSSINIAEVLDVKTGSVNDLLTPNRNLRIKGFKLKLVGENPAVGVYFIHQTTHERTKVEASEIVTNNPAELMIVTPLLAAGTYSLEVASQFSGSSSSVLKEPRTSVFDKVLTVQ